MAASCLVWRLRAHQSGPELALTCTLQHRRHPPCLRCSSGEVAIPLGRSAAAACRPGPSRQPNRSNHTSQVQHSMGRTPSRRVSLASRHGENRTKNNNTYLARQRIFAAAPLHLDWDRKPEHTFRSTLPTIYFSSRKVLHIPSLFGTEVVCLSSLNPAGRQPTGPAPAPARYFRV